MQPAEALRQMTRRELLGGARMGLGSVALSWLLSRDLLAGQPDAASSPVAAAPSGDATAVLAGNATYAPQRPAAHFPPRATSVIFLHMVGAPSHLDLFDPKPVLRKHDGQLCPEHYLEGQRFAFLRGHPRLLGTRFKFRPCGESGLPISERLPELGKVADEIAMIRSMRTEHFNHAPAQLFFETGFQRFGRPSVGSWVNYGLGSENDSLPAFVVLNTGAIAGAGNALWGSGFLPSVYQGIEFRNQGDPVLYLSDPPGISRDDRRRMLDGIQSLNRTQLADVGDPEIATRVAQYELAFRMQASVPELMDISDESEHVRQMYGAKPGQPSFANNCLLARRLVERGVRFVQLFDSGWDHHSNVFGGLTNKCKQVDRPIAALIRDLKQRGMLDQTLVVWGAEFGRTPMLQGDSNDGKPLANPGRDHHKDAYCAWMAGGGTRGGTIVGATDDLGYHIVEDPVHVHDFHATLLHLLGIDHQRLTYKFQGRRFRLTDVAGNVVTKLVS
jgi:hypothetical protein